MALPDLLAQLRATFPAGATQGTFEAARVQQGAYTRLLRTLGLPDVLPLTSAEGWTSDGTGAALAGSAQAALFGAAQPAVAFRFTPAGEDFTLLLDIALPAGWLFGHGFTLLDGTVFDGLALVDPAAQPDKASALVIASGPATDPLRLLGGAPLHVGAGLSFYGYFDPGSAALAVLALVLRPGQGPDGPVTGPVGYDATQGTVDLLLPLASATVTGLFGDRGPQLDLGLSLSSSLDSTLNQYLVGIRLDTVLEFGTTRSPQQSIDLTALLSATGQGVLDLIVSGSALDFPAPATLARYFGADNGIAGALPDKFSGGSLVQIDSVTFGVGLDQVNLAYAVLGVGALEGQTWKLWPGVLEVGSLEFVFALFDPLSPQRTAGFTFSGLFSLGPVVLRVSAQLPGEVVTAALQPGDRPEVLPLLAHVFGFTPPLSDELYIAELDFSADVAQGVYSGDLEIDGDLSFGFGDDNEIDFEQLSVNLAYSRNGPSGAVAAVFEVAQQQFSVALELTKGNTVFTGSWQDAAAPIDYQDLAIALGLYGLPNLPQGIDLGLTGADFEFDSAGPTFAFDLATTYGDAALVAAKNPAGAWGFVFGMILGLDLTVDLTSIPLVGRLVPQGDDVIALTGVRVVGANANPISYPQTDALKRILGGALNSGLVLSIDLKIGTGAAQTFTVRFGGPDDGTGDDTPPTAPALPGEPPGADLSVREYSGPGDPRSGASDPAPRRIPSAAPAADAPAPGLQITWVQVQRAFGPVNIQRLGFALAADDSLALLVDGGVSLAGLSVELTGLEATIPLQSPYLPSFSLAGLNVSYNGAGLTVGGGLGKAPGVTPAAYSGSLTIVFGDYGASASGSYSTTEDGRPSLYAFLFVAAPLGGPAFFFVTGLAGGFGYNRALKLPTIDQVADYPLVAGATGRKDAAQTQQALDQYITVAENENWLAAGVRFTSFGMVDSFVLATVSFGTSTRIALLGESTLTVPALPDGNAAAPLAVADLVLEVDVEPAAGVVSVQARLTPRSYVLAPDAHLTGGFAFFLWFGGNLHAGDFVVTLGGYNRYYGKPQHYPDVPRLALNWQASTELTVSGDLYFALTPALLMAGGGLKAAWSSPGVSAWFTADADFLVRFQPFAYSAQIAVSIGVSVTLDLLVTTQTVTVQVGVDLDLWGPPFGGTARIDLWIVSFTVSFGASPPAQPADLTWAQFSSAFLPPVQSAKSAAGSGAAAGTGFEPDDGSGASPTPVPLITPTDSLVVLAAPAGLLGTAPSGPAEDWLVDPTALRVALAVQVPIKQVSVTADAPVPVPGSWTTQFGIGPMGLEPSAVDVTLTVSVTRDGDPDIWSAAAVTGSVPAALWLNTAATLDAPRLVTPALTGLSLVPTPPAPDFTDPVPSALLAAEPGPPRDFSFSDTPVPDNDPFDQTQAWQTLAATLGGADPAVAAVRTGILAALRARGLTTAASVDTAAFAAQAPDQLTAPPALRLLGEQPDGARADRGWDSGE